MKAGDKVLLEATVAAGKPRLLARGQLNQSKTVGIRVKVLPGSCRDRIVCPDYRRPTPNYRFGACPRSHNGTCIKMGAAPTVGIAFYNLWLCNQADSGHDVVPPARRWLRKGAELPSRRRADRSALQGLPGCSHQLQPLYRAGEAAYKNNFTAPARFCTLSHLTALLQLVVDGVPCLYKT